MSRSLDHRGYVRRQYLISIERLLITFQEEKSSFLSSSTLIGENWETEDQVDLEWFDTESFFGTLLRQSLSVTMKLSESKEEVCGEAGKASRAECRLVS